MIVKRWTFLGIWLGAALTAALPAVVLAQGAPRWSVGAAGLLRTSPFAAEVDLDVGVFPYIAYRGDRFFLDGRSGGIHLLGGPGLRRSPLTVDALISIRTRPGTTRNKLTADGGARISYATDLGAFSLTYRHDITGTSNGSEITAGYSYTIRSGRLMLRPGLDIIRQSGSMANYLWGVTPAEHQAMLAGGETVLPVYALPGSVINLQARLFATYRLGDSWSLLAFGSLTRLDEAIQRNPGIDKTYLGTLGLGAAYSF